MHRAGLLVLGALAVVALFAAANPDEAEAKPCGSVALESGRQWIVGGSGMSCRKMRRWARSMLLGKGRPAGWTCRKHGRGPARSGSCSKRARGISSFFVYYPPD